MQKNAYFKGLLIPALLLTPQLVITVLFFYWPASQAVWQSFLLEDAFGTSTEFVWFENYQMLFSDPGYLKAFINTLLFSSFGVYRVREVAGQSPWDMELLPMFLQAQKEENMWELLE